MKKIGEKVTKTVKSRLDKILKSSLFENDLILRTQVIGNSLIRIIKKNENKIYFSVDGNYYIGNLDKFEYLQYNTNEKNTLSSDTEIEKLWKELC